MATGDVLIKWYDRELLAELKPLLNKLEKAAARRILAAAKRRCPVWDGEGRKISASDKSWKKREPGSLKKSLRIVPSKYKDGGYAVVAGNYDVFYASFVELGTKSWWARREGKEYPRRPLPEDPFLRGPVEREKRLFWKRVEQLLSGGILT